ncbi:hypothetical protein ACM66B_000569 [Microbotryomycetes sp. NB124-2]
MSDTDTLYDPPPSRRPRSDSGNVGVFRSSASGPSSTIGSLSRRNSVSTLVPASTSDDVKISDPFATFKDKADDSRAVDANFSDQEVERINRGAAARAPPDSDTSHSESGTENDDDESKSLDNDPRIRRERQTMQDPLDELADRKVEREGRRSKLQEMEEEPNYHPSAFMEHFHGELFELTHSIDELENDIDQIVKIRNKIVTLSPKQDPGQQSVRAMLNGQASLVNDTGRRIVALEQWLLGLYHWMKDLRAAVKRGETGASLNDVAEVKYQISSAKLDFANAMSRIREGAWKEEERRERTRVWMARHMRLREPDWEDEQVRKMLKAAELDSAKGIGKHLQDVTSYAALFALRNPFTELAELTRGMDFMKEALDREIVDEVIHNKPARSNVNVAYGNAANAPFKFHVVDDKHLESLDFEYGFARGQRKQRELNRKRLVIALLVVLIVFMVFIVWLASLKRGLGLDKPMDKESHEKVEGDKHEGAMWSAIPQPTATAAPDWTLTFGETVAQSRETGGILDNVVS